MRPLGGWLFRWIADRHGRKNSMVISVLLMCAGSLLALLRHKRSVLLVFCFTAGGSLCFYTFTTYMQKYLVNTAHMAIGAVSVVMTGVLVLYMLLQPVFGALSDRIGRKSNMLLFSGFATVPFVPLLGWLGEASSPFAAFTLVLAGLVIASFYTSISGVVKAEMFPDAVRALGVRFTYAVGNAMSGGTAEYVALSFKSSRRESWFAWYVAALCAVAFVASALMPDNRQESFLDGTAWTGRA